jgi:hypothetical protein
MADRASTGIPQMIGDWMLRLASFDLFGKAERPLPSARPVCCKTATFLQLRQTHFGGSEDTGLDGVPVTGADDFVRLLDAEKINRTIPLDTLRRSDQRRFWVALRERK